MEVIILKKLGGGYQIFSFILTLSTVIYLSVCVLPIRTISIIRLCVSWEGLSLIQANP